MRYIVWGTGRRCEYAIKFLGIEKIIAFIDNDKGKQGTMLFNRKIISFKEYIKNYKDNIILITPLYYTDIVKQIENAGIYSYLIYSKQPQECMGIGKENLLDNLPFFFDVATPTLFYGINLVALELASKLESYRTKIYFMPSKTMTKEQTKSFLSLLPFSEYMDKSDDFLGNVFLTTKAEHYPNFSTSAKVFNIYDFSHQFPEYYNPNIAKTCNSHKNESCFIVANGPSLTISDLDCLHKNKIFSFGMNKIYLAFEQTKWRPNCYAAQDSFFIEDYAKDISNLNLDSIYIGDTSKTAQKLFAKYNFNSFETFHVLMSDFCTNILDDFSEDAAWGVYGGTTIAYTCLQFAIYMGFKNIYLLGVDMNYAATGTIGNHFYKEEDIYTSYNPFNTELWNSAFNKAKDIAQSRGIKIYNATRGGKLEVFERVDEAGIGKASENDTHYEPSYKEAA